MLITVKNIKNTMNIVIINNAYIVEECSCCGIQSTINSSVGWLNAVRVGWGGNNPCLDCCYGFH